MNHSPSVAYDYDSIVWCVQRARQIRTWQNVYKIFKQWILCFYLFSIYILVVFLCYIQAYYENLCWDVYHVMLSVLAVVLSIFSDATSNVKHRRFIYSLLLCAAVLFYMHIICFYVVVINRVYYQQQVETWNAIKEEQFDLAIDEQAAHMLSANKLVISIVRVNIAKLIYEHKNFVYFLQFLRKISNRYTICSNIDEYLSQLAHNDRLAVAVSRKHAYKNLNIPLGEIHCFEDTEHFNGYPVSMFIPRGHPLKSKINERIQWSVEGGLIKKWALDSQPRFKKSILYSKHPVVLTLGHISLALLLYLIFFCLSCVAFIAEIVIFRMNKRPHTSRLWKILSMLIDGDRHFLLPPSAKRRELLRSVQDPSE